MEISDYLMEQLSNLIREHILESKLIEDAERKGDADEDQKRLYVGYVRTFLKQLRSRKISERMRIEE
jgi:hypothetical protein